MSELTHKDIMTMGHLRVAQELGIDIDYLTALAITMHDMSTSIYEIDTEYEAYVVYKHSKSITGDINILTKMYCPKEHRGKGIISRLLDRCPTPLITSDEIKVIR